MPVSLDQMTLRDSDVDFDGGVTTGRPEIVGVCVSGSRSCDCLPIMNTVMVVRAQEPRLGSFRNCFT
jgi:hypothetical protein